MTRPIRVLVCVAILSIAPSLVAGASSHRAPRYGLTPAMFNAVRRVNLCEEGGRWNVDGPEYFGGLGWLWATWQQFRRADWPQNMADAPPRMQGNALWRLVWHYRIPMPDQHGCSGGY